MTYVYTMLQFSLACKGAKKVRYNTEKRLRECTRKRGICLAVKQHTDILTVIMLSYEILKSMLTCEGVL